MLGGVRRQRGTKVSWCVGAGGGSGPREDCGWQTSGVGNLDRLVPTLLRRYPKSREQEVALSRRFTT